MNGENIALADFRRIEIHRPQYPQVLKWVDPEFHVMWINRDAAENANIICLMTGDDEEEGDENDGREE